MTRRCCARPTIPVAGLTLAVILAAAVALAGFPAAPAAADPGQASEKSTKTKQKTGRKRAIAVSCSPEEYCDLDFDAGRCVPNEKGKARKVECKLLKDE